MSAWTRSLGLLILGACAACASGRNRGGVAPETQQRSEELYGRQQRSMDSFNQTSSEQAGERFEYDTRPARPVEAEGAER